MISDKEIVENMTAKEKFNVMCRIKQIDEQKMAQSIYDIIESSDLADKDIYQGYVCIEPEDEWNEQYNRRCLNITYSLLETFDDWAKAHMKEYDISYKECQCLDWELEIIEQEFSEEQKEFIKLALECKIDYITLKW